MIVILYRFFFDLNFYKVISNYFISAGDVSLEFIPKLHKDLEVVVCFEDRFYSSFRDEFDPDGS